MLIGVLAVVGGLALLALRSDAGRDRGSRVGHVPQRPRRLERLRAAIVGNTKRAVASILGPPRVATFPGTSPASSNYLEADAWYYPLRTRYPAEVKRVVSLLDEFIQEQLEQ